MIQALKKIEEMVTIWLKEELIETMVNKHGHLINFKNYWSEGARTLGSAYRNNRKVEVFIKVRSLISVKGLKEAVSHILDQKSVRVFAKHTMMEHVRRIWLLNGACVKCASLCWYKKLLLKLIPSESLTVEVRKEHMHQDDVREKCLVVHAV